MMPLPMAMNPLWRSAINLLVARGTPSPARVLQQHTFSTTAPTQTKTIKPHRLPSNLIPPYPYGERRVYKQSNRGLYGTARIRFGNNVAEKHGNKSRRFWRPNVHVKAFYSPSLGARVKTRLTLRVLKTIRREGGIDNYLLKSKPARIKELGPGGWNLRWLLMQTRAVQERFNDERVALGLEPKEVVDRDDVIQYALDYATPGPLSTRSRATLDGFDDALADAFVLGDDALGDLEGVEELSDEAEERLLQEFDATEAASGETEMASRPMGA
ncbi:50S ribosomal protein L24 [Drechmeria coniospora]|uniref:Large ribosomal subunit protein bL28m n=1 Tax=Drechmeria coniospora TaxID=98403 RepID=A0A151GFM0_DRECN|nr:50S ribosomal protein L24 [Drechmeria coniospora]KYK55888.1 50S ribosomal protein L24 [Drechmeria coniospora]ODA81522.1 hypothetical protein RJ55_00021 [Drechmeria coniospora]